MPNVAPFGLPGRLRVYLSYVGASGAALVLDLAIFASLVWLAVSAPLAGAVGYLGGLGLHWLISSRYVFRSGAAPAGTSERRLQALMFCGTAGLGLVLTVAILAIGEVAGLQPWLTKPVAIAVSFQAVWFVRSRIVFAGAV